MHASLLAHETPLRARATPPRVEPPSTRQPPPSFFPTLFHRTSLGNRKLYPRDSRRPEAPNLSPSRSRDFLPDYGQRILLVNGDPSLWRLYWNSWLSRSAVSACNFRHRASYFREHDSSSELFSNRWIVRRTRHQYRIYSRLFLQSRF